MVCKTCLPLFLLLILAGHSAFGASETQEKALWALWGLQTNIPAQSGAIVAVCQQMQKTAPSNSLLPVYQGLAAWNTLRQGKTNEAIAIFNEMAAATTPSPLATAGSEMARRWLTRLDREKVRGALAVYYRHAIDYPINLQPLKKTMPGSAGVRSPGRSALAEPGRPGEKDALPLTDRWGAPWQYQLAEFKVIKGTRGQRYLLQSKTLLESSDLTAALAWPYAGRILFQPLSITTTGGGAQNVVFQTTGDRPEKILLSEGGQTAGITLVYIGSHILIVCDGDHWRVFPKPAR